MEVLTNAINWFEIPVTNFERARKFYSTILNTEIPEMELGPDRLGMLTSNGGVGGAIVQGPDYIVSQRGCLIYLNGGEDLSVVLDRVEAAGGRIEREKTPVSEVQNLGYHAIFLDSEGNRIGLHSDH